MPDEKSFESFFENSEKVRFRFFSGDDRSFPIDDADSITAESGWLDPLVRDCPLPMDFFSIRPFHLHRAADVT